MRVMNNLKMAVAAGLCMLMASCGSTRKMEGTGKVNAPEQEDRDPRLRMQQRWLR